MKFMRYPTTITFPSLPSLPPLPAAPVLHKKLEASSAEQIRAVMMATLRGLVQRAQGMAAVIGSCARRYASTAAAAPASPGEIFKKSVHNKRGLAQALDVTMRDGSHDMKVFGTGTLAALTSRPAYVSFAASHYHFYREIERRLDDAASASTPSGQLWQEFASDLRRAPRLEQDLETLLGTSVAAHPPSPATSRYVDAVADAAARERDGPPFLIAHFYCRYLADLFGGSMLGWPTRRALDLPDVPAFYVHDAPAIQDARFEYVERVYEAINRAGSDLDAAGTMAVADEARHAFALNAAVYGEDGRGSIACAALGGAKVLLGYARERVWTQERRDVFGRRF